MPYKVNAIEQNISDKLDINFTNSLVIMNTLFAKCSNNNDLINALHQYQFKNLDQAEFELRKLIQKNPMCADTRAGLTALLWRKGLKGEAKSNWAATLGLDDRYNNKEWLLNINNWPSEPIQDLYRFLDFLEQ